MGDVLGVIGELLKSYVIDPFRVEPQFRAGFTSCFLLLALSYPVLRFMLWCWKLISTFFRPTRLPATNSGPSPFQSFMGCVMVVAPVVMTAIAIIIWVVLSRPS